MDDEVQKILEILLRHEARPLNSPNCICGWRPALSLNDTESDRRQHRAHQAEMVYAKIAEET